jgi:hypothetical protein
MHYKLKTLGMLIVLAGVTLLPRAKAEEWNNEARVTLSVSVGIPGQVLAPGTYIFKLSNQEPNSNVMQVLSEDKSQIIATVLGVPAYRLQPTSDTEVTFEEPLTGNVDVVSRFFVAGELRGIGFIYSGNE